MASYFANSCNSKCQNIATVFWVTVFGSVSLFFTSPSINQAKCEFHIETVEYLRFVLSLAGLLMDTAKVKAMQDWPMPWKVKDIQSFLGFTNFYHCFIHGYSDIVTLMICLTQKKIPWL